MRLLSLGLALCTVIAAPAAEAKKYGKPLTLTQETKISEILASPDKFNGKRVRVSGVALDVCDERGCWVKLASDKKGQTLLFKVDDGVIIFPASIRGSRMVAEGVFSKKTFSVAEQKEMCVIEAQAIDPKFDPKAIKGPLTVLRIDGLGAEVK